MPLPKPLRAFAPDLPILREIGRAFMSTEGQVLICAICIFALRPTLMRADLVKDALVSLDPMLANRELRMRLMNIALYAVLPMALVPLLHKKSLLRDFGLQLPARRWFLFCIAYLALVHPINFLYATDPQLLERVPFYRPAAEGGAVFWKYQLLVAGAMVGWEFILRGYLLLGLRERFGAWAILIPMFPFVILHYSYPPLELWASILDGLFLGSLAYLSRSIWPPVFVHIMQNLLWEIEVVYWFHPPGG
jgi:membrane protease YdiL (CAAX protease family)